MRNIWISSGKEEMKVVIKFGLVQDEHRNSQNQSDQEYFRSGKSGDGVVLVWLRAVCEVFVV